MAFSKRFPRDVKGSNYPVWEDVSLSESEEAEVEREAYAKNLALMRECLDAAKAMLAEKGFKGFETSVVSLAVALFEKRASHNVFWKERRLHERFDQRFKDS